MLPANSASLPSRPEGRGRRRQLGVLVTLCVTMGPALCGQLPEYAAPRGGLQDPSKGPRGPIIRYRPLTRDDFRGPAPPEAAGPQADELGALTCAHIRAAKGSMLRAVPERGEDGRVLYRAEVKRIEFEAFVDPACSWWNASNTDLEPEYVLEHEQIHFALFELEARRLNREARQLAREIDVVGDSAEQVMAEVNRRFQDLLGRGIERTLQENRRFDEQTSLGYQRESQRVWRSKVEAELAATAPDS